MIELYKKPPNVFMLISYHIIKDLPNGRPIENGFILSYLIPNQRLSVDVEPL